jgi:hypothetical protein
MAPDLLGNLSDPGRIALGRTGPVEQQAVIAPPRQHVDMQVHDGLICRRAICLDQAQAGRLQRLLNGPCYPRDVEKSSNSAI